MFVEEPKKKKREYFLSAIDKQGNISRKVEVNSIEFKKKYDEPNLDWIVSEDSTMVAVAQAFDRNSPDIDFEYDVQVLDSDLNLLWENSVWLKKKSQEPVSYTHLTLPTTPYV